MAKPILICAQPDDQYFIFQVRMYIESCLEQEFTIDQIHILLYKPKERLYNVNWEKLKEIYTGLNIFVYEDQGVKDYLGIYIPILRPHILKQHFKNFPELENTPIIYTDCDILWTKNLNISDLLEDDVCYVSDAKSYLNYDYFRVKNTQILPSKALEASNRDFLKEVCDIVGIDKEVMIENNLNTGGVQYILKGITSEFWEKVEKDVLAIRQHLLQVNRDFYESENAGIQSWCADLWAVQMNLWFFGKKTKVVKELDFAWSTDPIEKMETYPILHNAGIVGDFQNGYPAFYKGKYVNGFDPLKDEHLYTIIDDPESRKYCTYYYTRKLLELNNKLTY